MALVFICIVGLLFVNEGLLTGSEYRNNVDDITKSFGAIISATTSSGMHIEHPFAAGNQMNYYYFYFFKAAEVIKMMGGSCSYKILIWLMFLDEIVITYSIIFLFFKLGTVSGIGSKQIILVSVILLVDGGLDSLWMMFAGGNAIHGGYIDGWVREVYNGYGAAIAHSNYMVKLVWQPQHISAAVPFLLFAYLVLSLLAGNKINWLQDCMLAACTVSILGYSTLMAIPMFAVISVIMVTLLVRKKLPYKYAIPFVGAFIISIPMLLIYLNGTDYKGSKIQFRTIEQCQAAFRQAPLISCFIFFIEYGSILFLAIAVLLRLFVKKRLSLSKGLIIASITVSFLLTVSLYTGGPNDLGMALSFVLYILLFVLVLSEPLGILKNFVARGGIIVLVFIGIMTNLKGLYANKSINVPLNARESSIMQLSSWMCENTVPENKAVIFSDALGDLNNYVPMLFHTKTFYPFHIGIQYLSGTEAEEIENYVLEYPVMSLEEKFDYFKARGIEYFIVLPESQETKFFEGMEASYQNDEYIVYKLDSQPE